jgi:hypothetical protein
MQPKSISLSIGVGTNVAAYTNFDIGKEFIMQQFQNVVSCLVVWFSEIQILFLCLSDTISNFIKKFLLSMTNVGIL